MSIEKEILDEMIPKLRSQFFRSVHFGLQVLDSLLEQCGKNKEKESVEIKNTNLLLLVSQINRAFRDSSLYIEMIESLLGKHEKRWADLLEKAKEQDIEQQKQINATSEKLGKISPTYIK